MIQGKLKATIRDGDTGPIKRVQEYKNINPDVLKYMIINNLASATPDNAMRVNYLVVGTGTSTPAASDTQLQTETFRNPIASASSSQNVAFITGFIGAAEDANTYREAGFVSDGDASANTGIIGSRVSINITKSLLESLTLEWEITLT